MNKQFNRTVGLPAFYLGSQFEVERSASLSMALYPAECIS